ncbi:hypothetical protein DPMN_155617 [Dreissena polymorpha]|uniref:PHD-type domain-containing protein n=1 Tax=Dreissena polymorpha TaxID=45954 RepID=A0A9D4JBI9_DREPO|nr:hypothetical protein DPMN_155617 [Dreissena polymorpha]
MALRELSKIKTFAEKEKRAKRKFVASIKEKSSKRKETNKKPVKQMTGKNHVMKENEESDEENVACMGCGCTWKEDENLGLGRTWVNCDFCKKWIHSECCSEQIDVNSDEPFSCPECS